MPPAFSEPLPGSSLALSRVSPAARGRLWGWRPRRAFALAFAVSVVVHLAFSFWPADPPQTPETQPLLATITELPPPPTPVAEPSPAKPKPRSIARRVVPRPPSAIAPEPSPTEEVPATAAASAPDAPRADVPPDLPTAPSAPVVAEETLPPEPLPDLPTKRLPPRVDLVYRIFFGTQGFYIGSATYRFEHSGNRYGIATVGEARGLAALILRGQGKVESRGVITAAGLQPDQFALERGKGRKREVAQFDWETGVVALDEDKTATLDLPTYDPLSFLWQFYFLPPTTDEQTFSIATTKRVTRYTFRREGTEPIALSTGVVETERWHRRSEDGKTDAFVWLAPTMHYVAVKLRFANTDRGTVEALLDAIHVDEAVSLQ